MGGRTSNSPSSGWELLFDAPQNILKPFYCITRQFFALIFNLVGKSIEYVEITVPITQSDPFRKQPSGFS